MNLVIAFHSLAIDPLITENTLFHELLPLPNGYFFPAILVILPDASILTRLLMEVVATIQGRISIKGSAI
jgi:hypothetical protein